MTDEAMRLFAGQFKTFDDATREELIDHIKRWEAISKDYNDLIGKLQAENADMREIVQAVASYSGELNAAKGGWVCHWCDDYLHAVDAFHADSPHSGECEVVKARALLASEEQKR